MLKTINNQVATEPFVTHSNQIEVKSGFAKAQTREILIKLKVVFDYSDIKSDLYIYKGDTIIVRGDRSLTNYAKAEYTLDGTKFVLVPVTDILIIEHTARI